MHLQNVLKTWWPYYAVGVSSLFGTLAYLNCGSSGSVVFNWFVNLANTSGFITWICCCIVYLGFRKACHAQNMEVPWKSIVQPYSTYIALVMFTLLVSAECVYSLLPEQVVCVERFDCVCGHPRPLWILAHGWCLGMIGGFGIRRRWICRLGWKR
jgi:amino acid permease